MNYGFRIGIGIDLARWAGSSDAGVVIPGPTNTVAPLVTYDDPAGLGSVLTTTNGTWTSDGTISGYTYQWYRSGAAISGAVANTYALLEADDDSAIRCRVTATDEFGSRGRSSNAVGPFDLGEAEGEWEDQGNASFIVPTVYEPGGDATHFRLYFDGLLVTTATATGVIDTPINYTANAILAHFTSYDFEWKSWNGVSENSLGYGAETFTTAPEFAPDDLALDVLSETEITLTWTLGDGETKVYRDGVLIATVAEGLTEYEDTGLTTETEYAYKLKSSAPQAAIDGLAQPDQDSGFSSEVSATTDAAPPSAWESPVSVSTVGDSIINTEGTIIDGANLGEVINPVVNGVTFFGDTDRDGLSAAFASASLYTDGVIGSGFAQMMQSVCYGDSNTETITLVGLTNGNEYLLQVFLSDDRGGAASSRTIQFTVAGHVSAAVPMGDSFSMICRFTATGTTQDLTLTGSDGTQLSGFQLRELP